MRVTCRVASRKRRKRILKRAKGYIGGRRKLIRTATVAVIRSDAYAYRHRRLKKREFRRLWITRLNAASMQYGIGYSRLIHGLKMAGVNIDRKNLSELAIHDPQAFGGVIEKVKAALSS